MKKCECCKKGEAICNDYRKRKDLLETNYNFTYTSPLTCYEKFTVCNECFHLEEKQFYSKLAKTEKRTALDHA